MVLRICGSFRNAPLHLIQKIRGFVRVFTRKLSSNIKALLYGILVSARLMIHERKLVSPALGMLLLPEFLENRDLFVHADRRYLIHLILQNKTLRILRLDLRILLHKRQRRSQITLQIVPAVKKNRQLAEIVNHQRLILLEFYLLLPRVRLRHDLQAAQRYLHDRAGFFIFTVNFIDIADHAQRFDGLDFIPVNGIRKTRGLIKTPFPDQRIQFLKSNLVLILIQSLVPRVYDSAAGSPVPDQSMILPSIIHENSSIL